jgi:hypothetical protein
MTLAKRLLLGSAAALVATSGAQAADLGLPVAPAVDYVQICSIGSFTGWVLPGSDVCFDISGYARGQLTWTEEIDPYTFGYGTAYDPGTVVAAVVSTLNVDGDAGPVFFDSDGTTAAADLDGSADSLDFNSTAATVASINALGLGYNTGVVDAVNSGWAAFAVEDAGGIFQFNHTAFAGAISFTNAGTGGFGATFEAADYITGLEALNVGGNNDENTFDGEARLNFDARTMTEYGLLRGFIRLGGENGGAANVDRAFVQLNVGALGFTAGLADSVFDPVFTGYGSGAAQGLGLADEANNQFSVNFAAGNGVTLSLSVEDDDGRNQGILALAETNNAAQLVAGDLWTLTAPGYDAAASMPDFIAAIRVDQAWGSAKLAAAMHDVNPQNAVVDSEIGYAISASAELNIPFGVGSTFGITGIYANGAQGFMGFNNEVGNASTGYVDAILVSPETGGTSLELTESYVIAAGFNFGLNSMVDLSIDGSYADVDHYGSLFDGNVWTVRGGIAYTPVNNLTINAHVSYASSDFNLSSIRTGVDDDEWGARFRVTRSF